MNNKFESVCSELIALQKAKNADYGGSFSESVKEFGMTAAIIPLSNKVNRLKQLIQSDSAQVKHESIDDTLKDLACYAIMTLVERETYKTQTPNDMKAIWDQISRDIATLELNIAISDFIKSHNR